MKLIYCPGCKDLVRLFEREEVRRCVCGRAWGRYRNGRVAEVGGSAVVVGVPSREFGRAMTEKGRRFEGYRIEEPSDGVRRVERKE